MTTKIVKTAISLPRQDFMDIEAFRKRRCQSRSEVLLIAIRSLLQQDATVELENRYEMGYRKHPEKLADIESFMNAGLPAWKGD